MNFHGRMMNIRDGADGAASIEYKRGHRDARHAACKPIAAILLWIIDALLYVCGYDYKEERRISRSAIRK